MPITRDLTKNTWETLESLWIPLNPFWIPLNPIEFLWIPLNPFEFLYSRSWNKFLLFLLDLEQRIISGKKITRGEMRLFRKDPALLCNAASSILDFKAVFNRQSFNCHQQVPGSNFGRSHGTNLWLLLARNAGSRMQPASLVVVEVCSLQDGGGGFLSSRTINPQLYLNTVIEPFYHLPEICILFMTRPRKNIF